ncbi:MAG TPA: hypothetical protein VE046_01455 [Steroidobacteraceae bacterium]|nr:hypothetical protein [Steroidobacteraceae bacterium]
MSVRHGDLWRSVEDDAVTEVRIAVERPQEVEQVADADRELDGLADNELEFAGVVGRAAQHVLDVEAEAGNRRRRELGVGELRRRRVNLVPAAIAAASRDREDRELQQDEFQQAKLAPLALGRGVGHCGISLGFKCACSVGGSKGALCQPVDTTRIGIRWRIRSLPETWGFHQRPIAYKT